MIASFVIAFLGGALALLSPCGGLLLPAFFAFTSSGTGRLLARTTCFFVGLLIVLLPLGAGAGFMGELLGRYRMQLIFGASILLIVLGLAQIFGRGFDLGKLIPEKWKSGSSSLAGAFVLGMISSLAGFCTGPILGAVLTVAAVSGSTLKGMLLLAVYGVGIVVPLLLIAAAWQAFGAGKFSWLRGKTVRWGRLEVHLTSLITGLIFIIVGLVFIVTNGLLAAPEVISTAMAKWIQEGLIAWVATLPDAALVMMAAGVFVVLWFAIMTPLTKPRKPAH